jgi:hypothetical protein
MRGLVKLVLHCVLYVWLRLLFGLFWSSEDALSNSTEERRGSEESLVSSITETNYPDLKRPSHEIFDLRVFHKSTGPRPLVNILKYRYF